MRPAMPAIELSASIFCARDMRGTLSMAEYRNKPLLQTMPKSVNRTG
jgi:hypothetical protein